MLPGCGLREVFVGLVGSWGRKAGGVGWKLWGLSSGLGPRANSLGFERWAEVSRLEELAAGM